jgi:hypothetical protein
MRDLARGLATLLAAAAGTAALLAAGWVAPALALPLGAPATIPSWWARVGPAVATFAGFRLVAMAAGAYLVAVLVVAGAARVAGRGQVQRLVTTLVPRSLRGPVALLAGVCVAAGSVGGAGLAGATTLPLPTRARASSPAAGAPSPSLTPPASLAPPASLTPSGGRSAGDAAGAPPSLPGGAIGTAAPGGRPERRGALADGGPQLAPPPVLSPLGPVRRAAPDHRAARRPAAPRRRPGVPAAQAAGAAHGSDPSAGRPAAGAPIGAGIWVVQPGQSFWSIAEAVVAATGQESPADVAAVAAYWSRLIAANQDHLPVPGDPDLLFVGDRLVLPLPR